MKTGEALGELPLVKVMQVSRRMSGVTLADVAAAVDRDPDTIGCWFAESADKTPPLPLVPKLCAALGNPLLIEWLFERYLVERQSVASSLAGAATERVRMLLIRGMGQLTAALNLTQDMGPALSRPESRQVAESILLAVSTLAEAAREARGPSPAPSRRLMFSRADAASDATQDVPEAVGRGGWLSRLRRRLAAWIDGGETIRERDAALADQEAWCAQLLREYEADAAGAREAKDALSQALAMLRLYVSRMEGLWSDPLGRESFDGQARALLERHGR